jgi:hypothetical protein
MDLALLPTVNCHSCCNGEERRVQYSRPEAFDSTRIICGEHSLRQTRQCHRRMASP